MTYRDGSKSMAHDRQNLTALRLEWLGVSATDMTEYVYSCVMSAFFKTCLIDVRLQTWYRPNLFVAIDFGRY